MKLFVMQSSPLAALSLLGSNLPLSTLFLKQQVQLWSVCFNLKVLSHSSVHDVT